MEVDGRKVFTVRAFNQGIASWLERLPTVWVEGEVTELRRQDRWASVFLTLKDPESGACLAVQMPRGQFDGMIRTAREEAARRLARELDLAVERFAREAESVLAVRVESEVRIFEARLTEISRRLDSLSARA